MEKDRSRLAWVRGRFLSRGLVYSVLRLKAATFASLRSRHDDSTPPGVQNSSDTKRIRIGVNRCFNGQRRLDPRPRFRSPKPGGAAGGLRLH